MDKNNERSQEIREFLTSLFVDKRSTFKQMVVEINRTLKEIIKIDYQYTYDDFCSDYLNLFVSFFERNPEVDYMDLELVSQYTNIILGELFIKLKIKYSGNGNEGKDSEQSDS
jgi:hypothetical protein